MRTRFWRELLVLVVLLEASCAPQVAPRQSAYHYSAKVSGTEIWVTLDPSKEEIVVRDRGQPAYFCTGKDDSFCVRSDELFLEIPRTLTPKEGVTWASKGVTHVYHGALKVDFRGRPIYVHRIQTSKPSFGTVDFFISPAYGLIRFRVAMPEGTAQYELTPELSAGWKVFEGNNSKMWN
jgi:hypothetical protein